MKQPPLIQAKELEQLRLQAATLVNPAYRRRGSSAYSGQHLSPQRGSGLELEDLRPYQYGDDIRHIAWRVTARTGRPVTKIFRSERRAQKLLVIEHHPGMMFGTRTEPKAATALRAAALLSFAALKGQDEIGAVLFGQRKHFFPHSLRLDQTLTLLRLLNHDYAASPASSGTPPAAILNQLRRLGHRGQTVYLISDLLHWGEAEAQGLKQLAREHELHAVQICDEGEFDLAAAGKLRLRSPYDGQELIIDSDNPKLRQAYKTAMADKQQQLDRLLQRCGVRHHRLWTHQDILSTMGPLL